MHGNTVFSEKNFQNFGVTYREIMSTALAKFYIFQKKQKRIDKI